jgi:hypothetical protein
MERGGDVIYSLTSNIEVQIANMLAANLILLFFVFIVLGGTSFNYYLFTYELTEEEFNQYLRNLFFPLTLLRKFMRIEYFGFDGSKLHDKVSQPEACTHNNDHNIAIHDYSMAGN